MTKPQESYLVVVFKNEEKTRSYWTNIFSWKTSFCFDDKHSYQFFFTGCLFGKAFDGE